MAAVMGKHNQAAVIAIRIHCGLDPLHQLRWKGALWLEPRRSANELTLLDDGNSAPVKFRGVVAGVDCDDAPVFILKAEKTGPLPVPPLAIALAQSHLRQHVAKVSVAVGVHFMISGQREAALRPHWPLYRR